MNQRKCKQHRAQCKKNNHYNDLHYVNKGHDIEVCSLSMRNLAVQYYCERKLQMSQTIHCKLCTAHNKFIQILAKMKMCERRFNNRNETLG